MMIITHLFIRLANQHSRCLCLILRDVCHSLLFSFWPFIVLSFVDSESQTLALLYNSLPQKRALLANSTSEDQRIHPALEFNEIVANEAADAVDDDVQGQFVLFGRRILDGDFGEICCAGQDLPARLFVKDFFGLGERYVRYCCGVRLLTALETYSADMHFSRACWTEIPCFIGVVEDQTVLGQYRCLCLADEYNRDAYHGSTSPLRVAPGSPASGVSPILKIEQSV